jgi:hypothetical protein
MGTNLHINEQRMQEYYDQVMDQVLLLYHTHPSNLIHISLSDTERAEMAVYDAMGQELAESLKGKPEHRTKKVRLHTDSHFSNGLPRRKY